MQIVRGLLIGTVLAAMTGFAHADQTKPTVATTMQKQAATTNGQGVLAADETKLSKDGADAFRDVQLARVAIYEANPDAAKKSIDDAGEALIKAKADSTAFVKAEADLKPRGDAKTKVDPAQKPSTTPVAWLPVDGELTLGENFTATPEKAAALADANKHLAAGDRKSAIEKLKLANVDVFYTIAILPLDQTIGDVAQAKQLVDSGKYYEANAIMKKISDSVRYDTVAAEGAPQSAAVVKSAPMQKE
jgi:hypothetical protein